MAARGPSRSAVGDLCVQTAIVRSVLNANRSDWLRERGARLAICVRVGSIRRGESGFSHRHNELLSRIDPTIFHCLEVSATLEVAGATEAPSIASAEDLRAFHDDGVTPTSGDASDPGNDAIALNEGPTDAPDDLVDDDSGGRARLLWRKPRRPVACQRSSLVL